MFAPDDLIEELEKKAIQFGFKTSIGPKDIGIATDYLLYLHTFNFDTVNQLSSHMNSLSVPIQRLLLPLTYEAPRLVNPINVVSKYVVGDLCPYMEARHWNIMFGGLDPENTADELKGRGKIFQMYNIPSLTFKLYEVLSCQSICPPLFNRKTGNVLIVPGAVYFPSSNLIDKHNTPNDRSSDALPLVHIDPTNPKTSFTTGRMMMPNQLPRSGSRSEFYKKITRFRQSYE
jgi:hypothetical protein